MMMMIGALAHNVMRDVLAVSGFVEVRWSGATGTWYSAARRLGRARAKAFRLLLEAEHVRVTLG